MKILFGVFDWGLGHATRDKPLISELLKKGNKVEIISTGRALILLKNSFGKKCKYFDVPSVHNPYSKHRFFAWGFTKNIPKMIWSLKKSRELSKKIIEKENYDIVISDCRYDVYDREDNSYLINHQLRFKTFPIAQATLESWLASRMNYYNKVIVPDYQKNNLTGILSHDLKFFNKSKISYTGILSHLKKKKTKKDIDFFISISGPEPQRTVLENIILPQLSSLKGNIVVTLGKPEADPPKSTNNIKIYSFLDSKKQEEMMNKAKFVITRSGYTTMMELAELDIKKALLIPTPGQSEQEYLADLYEKNKWFHHVNQYKLNLAKDIQTAKKFRGFKPSWKTKDSIKKFMKIISKK